MSLSLYIHIPFCLKKCIYCDFVSGIYNPEEEIVYIKALKEEISRISEETSFSTLYIGGGTPTVFSVDTLTDLINHIFKHLNFTKDYEATIEANPGTVDKEKLKAIRSTGINPAPQHGCGVNRISIGVQSFNDEELDFLGRLHSSSEAEQAVCLARETGFKNIGIDLIYGIPGQNIESWKKTLERAVSLKPEHISTYELTVEEGTPLYECLEMKDSLQKKLKIPLYPPFSKGGMSPLWQRGVRGDFIDTLKLPDEEKIIEMYEYTIDYLKTEGFVHYEISNFAIPGYFCRHNLNYWQRGEYYGAGLGAHSFIKEKRFYNTDVLEDYISLISENQSTIIEKAENITEEKALTEAIFLGLRKTAGINVDDFSERYGKDILSLYKDEIKELQDAGLIEVNGSSIQESNMHVKLTKRGLLLSNEVFLKFMR